MTAFGRIDQSLVGVMYDQKFIPNASPNDYLASIGRPEGDFKLPTVCAVHYSPTNVIFLGRDEWGTVLPSDVTCVFVTYPKWAGSAGGALTVTYFGLSAAQWIVVAVVVVAVAASLYAAQYNGSSKPAVSSSQSLDEQKPTYQLTDQGNSNRLGQPIPVQYGRIRSYPDLGAASYSEYLTNDQHLFVLLVLGEGSFDVEELFIDDTPITSFDGVTYNVLPPATAPTIVDLVETAKDVGNVELDATFAGPFVATAVGSVSSDIAIDITFPSGLFSSNGGASNSVDIIGEVRQIDDEGIAIGPYIEVFTETVTELSKFAINKSFKHTLATPGRYEVRVKRVGSTTTSFSASDQANWTGLRSYANGGHPDYGEKTLIEIKIKASAQLNNTNAGIFNVISTRKLNVYNGATFDFEATTSVVWAFYDLIVNTEYGAGLDSATRVDIDELYIQAQQFDAAGYECNMRLENSTSAMEALTQIGQAARCQVYQRSGRLWLVRDEPRVAVTAFFTPANIVKDSMSIQWELPSINSSNYVRVTYLDEDTWKEEEVAAVLPGISPTIPEEIRLISVTNRQKAWEEGMFYAAQDRYRRKIITFETDIEGYLPDLLDHISVSHDNLIDFTSGTVQSYDAPDFFLDEPPDFKGSDFGYISFKAEDGRMIGPFSCVPGDTAYKVRVVGFDEIDDPIIEQISQPTKDPTRYSFGPGTGSQGSFIAILLSIDPVGDGKASIRCVNNDPRVFTSGVGVAPPIGSLFQP